MPTQTERLDAAEALLAKIAAALSTGDPTTIAMAFAEHAPPAPEPEALSEPEAAAPVEAEAPQAEPEPVAEDPAPAPAPEPAPPTE